MYFDLGGYQERYTVAYSRFKEYIAFRVGESSIRQIEEINVQIELGMKNTHIPVLEGYLVNFFNSHDIKITIDLTKRGAYIPRVFLWNKGEYINRLTQEYDNRNDAILKAIDYAFTRLNLDLILEQNYKNPKK